MSRVGRARVTSSGAYVAQVRVICWNVNSVRARIDHLRSVIEGQQPDVLLLQETRCTDAAFPHDLLAANGYLVAHHGIDHRNGVAIASRVGLEDVRLGFRSGLLPAFDETRIVSATCGQVRMSSVYVPNGRTLTDTQYTYKLQWLERLRAEAAADLAEYEHVLVAGDFNVAPADIDIYNPSRFRRTTHASPPERAAIAALEGTGLVDVMRRLHPGPELYTWWSYAPGQAERNLGMRIDLAFASAALAERVTAVDVDRGTRVLPRASDHAPVVVDLRD